MRDPRIVLKDELIAIGILSKQASIIALDTGSSQVIVNKEYLYDFKFSKIITTKALATITNSIMANYHWNSTSRRRYNESFA